MINSICVRFYLLLLLRVFSLSEIRRKEKEQEKVHKTYHREMNMNRKKNAKVNHSLVWFV